MSPDTNPVGLRATVVRALHAICRSARYSITPGNRLIDRCQVGPAVSAT